MVLPAVAAIGMPGTTELIIILVIVVIVFGVGKLPAVLKSLGAGVKEFRDASTGDAESAKDAAAKDAAKDVEKNL
jgi:sec-independent protein translocase protein TatA